MIDYLQEEKGIAVVCMAKEFLERLWRVRGFRQKDVVERVLLRILPEQTTRGGK